MQVVEPVTSTGETPSPSTWLGEFAAVSLDPLDPSAPSSSNLAADASLLVAARRNSSHGLSTSGPDAAVYTYAAPQPSTSYSRSSFLSYPAVEEQLEPLSRSYSATSDIRGTLDHSRGSTQGSEEWATHESARFHVVHQYSAEPQQLRRESEPAIYAAHRSYNASTLYQHRASLPHPLERADSLPIRRLRRSVGVGSPGPYAASSTPSLTDGSASPSTSRGSFVDSPYFHQAAPIANLAAQYDNPPPFPVVGEGQSYPFPDLDDVGQLGSSMSRRPQSASTPQQDLNVHRKRPSLAPTEEYPTWPSQQLQTAFGHFSFSSSSTATTPHSYAPPPPSSEYLQPQQYPQLQRAFSHHEQHHPISPHKAVYDVDGSRQLYLPGQQRFGSLPGELLPPHDAYEPMKKRRMSTAGATTASVSHSHSLGERREAASSLHLDGLPPPPLSGVAFHHALEQPHSACSHDSAAYPSTLPRTPSSTGLVRSHSSSYGYASFASPSTFDRLAPLPSLDSPITTTPYRDSRTPLSPGSVPGSSHSYFHPFPPSSSHSTYSASTDYLPVPPPSAYPHTPNQRPSSSGPCASASTSTAPATTFSDPSYPTTETSPFAICHRRPPQADFDSPPPGGEPVEQKLRFEEDQYTPAWVRFEKTKKEGWCALCPGDGKWLQLKNSAYWYHRQFIHGVSSSSGHYFLPPLELRKEGENGRVIGLCHGCAEWHPYQSSGKNNNSSGRVGNDRPPSQWFHHAHKCHTYFSPRKEARKNAKLGL
ncbi:hypothetical protein JCM6882_002112 [Rhodosporidiobolus microsporus]